MRRWRHGPGHHHRARLSPTEPVVLAEGEGKNTVLRVGATVHRPAGPSAPAVHQLLAHLDRVGFGNAPRPLALDGDTQVLTYLPGTSGPDAWDCIVDEDSLASAAQLLRQFHDATADFVADGDLVDRPHWTNGVSGGPAEGEVMLHGDCGPWNIVFDDGRAVGLIDLEHANPGNRLEDLGYLVAYAAPLCPDAEALGWMRHPDVPDRRRRIRILAEAYGVEPDGLATHAAAAIAKTTRTIERLARLGFEPQATWAQPGRRINTFWARHRWIIEHLDEFDA